TDIVGGFSLRQTRDIQRQDLFGSGIPDVPLGYLLRHQEATEITAALTGTTRFFYTSQLQQDRDVVERVRAYSRYAGWGLEQRLGGGRSALTLGFSQGKRETRPFDSHELEIYSEKSYSLDATLGQIGPLKATYSTAELEGIRDVLGRTTYQGGLIDAPQRAKRTYKADVTLPFTIRGGTAKAEYHRQATVVGGVEDSTRTTLFTAPLAFWSKDASFTWQLVGRVQRGAESEQRVTTAVLPISAFGLRIGNQFTETRASSAAGESLTRAWVWQVPFEKQTITLGYTAVQPYAPTGQPGPRQRIEVVQLPMLTLFTPRVKAGFSQSRTEMIGGPTVRSTKWNVELAPIDKVHVAAQVTETDSGPGQCARTTDVRSDIPIAARTALNWRYLETQQVGVGPAIGREVAITQEIATSLPIKLQVAYSTYDTPGDQPEDSGLAAKLSLGKPDSTTLSATLAQFDEASLGHFQDDVVDVCLRQPLGSRLGVEWRYQDQPGRPGPLRSVALAGDIGDNKVRVAAVTFPQDPRNARRIRAADHYEAELQRNIGSVQLSMGYRRCEYRPLNDGADNFFKVGLAGGKPEGGGQIALTYATGDFVLTPSGGVFPGSVLELRYSKRFDDDAELSLTLRRTTPPWDALQPEGQTEGRLEVKALW
ncbi:MAG: hypothetical protein H5T86_10775, partial [Armatimonadetes bacterium]|nr:hypothetical protein [Armatimonadota bacterium]